MNISLLIASYASDDLHILYMYRALEIQSCSFPESQGINSASGWSENHIYYDLKHDFVAGPKSFCETVPSSAESSLDTWLEEIKTMKC